MGEEPAAQRLRAPQLIARARVLICVLNEAPFVARIQEIGDEIEIQRHDTSVAPNWC